MKKLLLLSLALLAAYLAGRAVKRNAEVIAALWVLVGMTASVSTANTPKTRSVENRLNTLVPQVFPNTGGTVNGSMTVTGSHTVGGQVNAATYAGSGGGAMENSSGIHTSGQMVADNGVTASSTISTNAGYEGASIHVTGNAQVDGTHTVSGTITTDSGYEGQSIHVTGNSQSDGSHTVGGALYVSGIRIAPNQSAGGWPIASGQAWGPSVVSVLNQLVGALNGSGITNT